MRGTLGGGAGGAGGGRVVAAWGSAETCSRRARGWRRLARTGSTGNSQVMGQTNSSAESSSAERNSVFSFTANSYAWVAEQCRVALCSGGRVFLRFAGVTPSISIETALKTAGSACRGVSGRPCGGMGEPASAPVAAPFSRLFVRSSPALRVRGRTSMARTRSITGCVSSADMRCCCSPRRARTQRRGQVVKQALLSAKESPWSVSGRWWGPRLGETSFPQMHVLVVFYAAATR